MKERRIALKVSRLGEARNLGRENSFAGQVKFASMLRVLRGGHPRGPAWFLSGAERFITETMKKIASAIIAVSLPLSMTIPASAQAAEPAAAVSTVAPGAESPSDTEVADPADAEQEGSSQGEKIALGVGITAAVLAAAAGGTF